MAGEEGLLPLRAGNLQLIRENWESFVSLLEKEDLAKLCFNLVRGGVISKEVRDKFTSLDPDEERLPSDMRVRYLLQQVCERIKKDMK